MGEQTEGIGIALEMGDIIPKHRRNLLLQHTSRTLSEEGLNGFLARVPKRWVTHVVSQTGGSHNLPYLAYHRLLQFGTTCQQHPRHIVA